MSVTASSKLGIGLIGVGRHGSRYIKHLLHDMPDITLVALGRKRNDQDSGSLPAVPVYADYRGLIADPKVQAIVVVTPPTVCHDICLAAIRASKPLLIEKPLAPTAEEARAMVSAANHAGILLMTAQTLRFDSTIEKVKGLLPQIGTLRAAHMTTHIELTSGTAVSGPGRRGALLEIGIHLLDAIRYLTGDEVRDVRCTMEPAPSTGPELRASASLKTAHGTDIHLDIARVANGRVAHMTWIGSSGEVSADWSQGALSLVRPGKTAESWTVEPRPTILAVLQAFTHAIRTKTRPPVTGEDGQKAVEIAEACYRSAELNGQAVPVTYVL